ncbi:alpha/beta hydrolase [Deinococcus sp. SM5_A1]|uniref:alpha/beta hydrolase n=1 Tax=Deinococcus sp. SM5_A1 TaxID=3379094 RepID=UPI00385F3D62
MQADIWRRGPGKLGIVPVVAVGHDLGGGVVQKLAVRHPNLVRGLFVTNAIPCDSWPVPGVKIMRALGSLVKHLPDAVFQEVLRLFYRIGHGSSRQAFRRTGRSMIIMEGRGLAFGRCGRSTSMTRSTLRTACPRLTFRRVWSGALPIGSSLSGTASRTT